MGSIAPNCPPTAPVNNEAPEAPESPPVIPDPEAPQDPEPPVIQDPPEEGSFFVTDWRDQWSDLHGVNIMDPVLNRNQGATKPSGVNHDFINTFTDRAVANGFNVFRIPARWEAYEGAETVFLNELEALVSKADAEGIAVWVEVHHFYTSSNWAGYGGSGFPKSLTDCYDPSLPYEDDPEVRQFWEDYYNNDMRDRGNNCNYGLNVWDLHADFMIAMADRINNYDNVIGYEILNEPHIWKRDHYTQLGDLHTYIGAKLKPEAPGKAIIFTRETAHGKNPDGTDFQRSVGLEPWIIPRLPVNTELVYAPHVYDLPELDQHISNFETWRNKWHEDFGFTNIRIAVGEFATQPPQLPEGEAVTPENMEGFVSAFKAADYAFTYWQLGGCRQGEGNVLYDCSGDITEAGIYYRNAILKFYGAPLVYVGLSASNLIMAVNVCAVQFAQTQSVIFSLMGILSFGIVIKAIMWFKERIGY